MGSCWATTAVTPSASTATARTVRMIILSPLVPRSRACSAAVSRGSGADRHGANTAPTSLFLKKRDSGETTRYHDFVSASLSGLSQGVNAAAFLDRLPQPLRRCRHTDMAEAIGTPQRVHYRVHHRRA